MQNGALQTWFQSKERRSRCEGLGCGVCSSCRVGASILRSGGGNITENRFTECGFGDGGRRGEAGGRGAVKRGRLGRWRSEGGTVSLWRLCFSQ